MYSLLVLAMFALPVTVAMAQEEAAEEPAAPTKELTGKLVTAEKNGKVRYMLEPLEGNFDFLRIILEIF